MSTRPTAMAHQLVAEIVRPGDLVIDATLGNGHDTLFLAQLVGEKGQVVGFDIQADAVAATQRRLQNAEVHSRCQLFTESHRNLLKKVGPEATTAVMFNLGYLPGGDHSLITETAETLAALDQATLALKPGGILTIVCYPGHDGGNSEAQAVAEWARSHEGKVFPQTREDAPFLVIWRRQ